VELRHGKDIGRANASLLRPIYKLGATAALAAGICTLGAMPNVRAQDSQNMTCANAPNKITPAEYRRMDTQSAKYRTNDNPQLARFNPDLNGPDPGACFGDCIVGPISQPGAAFGLRLPNGELFTALLTKTDNQNHPITPLLSIGIIPSGGGQRRIVGNASLASVEAQYMRTHNGRKPGGYRLVADLDQATNTVVGWEFDVIAIPVSERGAQPDFSVPLYFRAQAYPSEADAKHGLSTSMVAGPATGMICQPEQKVATK